MKKILLTLLLLTFSIGISNAQKVPSVTFHINGKTYNQNDLVSLDGIIYKALSQTNITPPNGVFWDEVGTGAGSLSLPLNEVGFGTGTGITSSTGFTHNSGTLNLGITDTQAGTINLRGTTGSQGGIINFYNGSNDGSNIGYRLYNTFGEFELQRTTGSQIWGYDWDGKDMTLYNSAVTSLSAVGTNATFLSIIKQGSTSDDILLGDGTTTSLAAISGGSGWDHIATQNIDLQNFAITSSTNQSHINFISRQGFSFTLDNDDDGLFSSFDVVGTGNFPVFRFYEDGKALFNNYGQGNITGTAAYNLALDSSGNVIETALGGGSGAVDSVNGEIGVVSLDTGDIPEVTDNNYVTDVEKTKLQNLDLVVTTIADLRAITVEPINGQRIFVKGHTNEGIGGGLFYWDSSSTEADNNGVYIKATTITTGRFIRYVENNTVSIEDFGGLADTNDNTTDDTFSFINAIDYLVSNGGGKLILPIRNGLRFFITNNENLVIRNYSNIHITGGGSIFIDSVNNDPAINLTQGRGTLVKIGNGTNNFKMSDLDILVDEGTLANDFINGVICQEELASWNNLKFENLKIHSENRPDTQVGNHGITFYRDTNNALDVAISSNLTINNCNVYLTGNSVYGFHSLRKIDGVTLTNNRFEGTANTDINNDAYNGLAIYGDCINVYVNNNRLYGWGHSSIAVSMAENVVVDGNFIYNILIDNEAGIEIEYKEGHGTNLTDPDFQTKSIKITNNYVENCYWGYAVLVREVSTSSSTQKPPFDILIQGNTGVNNLENDLVVASNISGTPDYTERIRGVRVDNNYFYSDCDNANIHVYDSDGISITNNDLFNGDRNLWIGRSSTIYPIGKFKITGNTMKNAQTNASVRFESMGANAYIEYASNIMDGNSNGVFGIQATSLHESGVIYNIHHNELEAFTDAIRMDVESADTRYSQWAYNIAKDCTGRGFDLVAEDGLFTYNTSINCTTNDTYGGTNNVSVGNRDL